MRISGSRAQFVIAPLLVVGVAAAFRGPAPARSTLAAPARSAPSAEARSTEAAPPAAAAPALVVLITIDQMRGDYLTRFGPQLRGGLARLSRGGAWYTNAHHDHAITETAPGHATLLSGRFPRSTGIMMNAIGVEDAEAPLLAGGYGPGASPKRFNGTTLVDWLRASQSRSRALSVSMKDRGAILPVGKSKSDVFWYSIDGRFTTSSYYRTDLPAWVNAFNARMLPASFAGKQWTLLLPDSAYTEPDNVPVEGGGTDVVFPHKLPDDAIDAQSLVRVTPFMDDIVLAFALDGLTKMSLGTGPQTDVLAISLSATDVIGHRFGPDSREIHDQILQVDRALGRFLDSLYTLRDSTRVTVVLTGDHGVGTIPELANAKGVLPPPVRASVRSVIPSLRARLRAAKVDTFAIDVDQNLVLVNRAAFAKAPLLADSLLDALAVAARALPGVARVDRFKALLADTLTDPIARRWSHQFPANVNVELIITLTPFSTWGGNVASHGSPYDFDSNVPLIFFGDGIAPGKHADFVRTVDLAPTLAELLGVKPLEKIDGVPLKSALR
jgi:predicted AlkP superfamily pyrophosphatase or phosphodiesterase